VRRWVIADTHFGHKMLIEKGYRPANFEKRIIDQWTALVAPEDLVIHLGDLAFSHVEANTWNLLPGRKVLVRGNHDNHSITWYMERGFAFACDMFELGKIIFTHAPLEVIPVHVSFNLHGHLHTGEHRPFEPSLKHRLISLERTNYAPVLIEKVLRKKIVSGDSESVVVHGS
jgi:calcineurin-like phosphoesterase family protein